MNLAEARTWMLNNPGKKITCSYFATNEWIMWDSEKLSFIFEDDCYPYSRVVEYSEKFQL